MSGSAALAAPSDPDSDRPWPRWAYGGMGAVAALIGLLPWMITGMRLPLQNLWAEDALPGAMPRAMLPFSQYELALIFGLIVFGAALAGIASRMGGRTGSLRTMVGVLVIDVAALLQSAITVGSGLAHEMRSVIYLGGLIGITVLSIMVGLITLVLLAAAPRPAAVVGATLGALAAGTWVGGLIRLQSAPGADTLSITTTLQWLPSVLIGAALAWCGLRGSAIVGWLASLALLWLAPAVLTAVSYVFGSRVYQYDPIGMLSSGGQVLIRSLGPEGISYRYVAAAALIGLIGLLVRRCVRLARR